MLRTRALAILAAAGCAAALLTACERSATAPLTARASVAPGGMAATLSPAEEGATTSGLLDLQGGVIELADRPGYPLRSMLSVPAGFLESAACFDVVQQVSGDALTLRISGRPIEELQGPTASAPASPDAPIVLTIGNVGSEAREITVIFSPPDGSEPVVVRASLQAGQATTLAYRRGRSKYSVIIF